MYARESVDDVSYNEWLYAAYGNNDDSTYEEWEKKNRKEEAPRWQVELPKRWH